MGQLYLVILARSVMRFMPNFLAASHIGPYGVQGMLD